MGLAIRGGRPRPAWAGLCLLALAIGAAQAQQVLTVAAFPAVDEIVRAAVPAWKKLHPTVDVKVVSRQFSDHHTAMTTALSTSVYLPDVMALEVGYVGRFAQGGGLEDLSQAPYHIKQFQTAFVPYAFQQATNRKGAVVAVPTDIGPGTLLYRADVLAKAGVGEAELTASWDSYVASGAKIKAATGAYLMAHARDMKDMRHPHRHPARRGAVLRPAVERARHLAAFRARLRAGAPGAPAKARRPGRDLVERVVRGLQARHASRPS